MLVSFPSPVLFVAVDVVRDLDEYEALPGLWTLFTKCKGSLKDGRRLENISWRLWYREMMAASPERHKCALVYDSEKHAIEGGKSEDNAYRPPTPEEGVIDPESSHLSSSQPPHPPGMFYDASFNHRTILNHSTARFFDPDAASPPVGEVYSRSSAVFGLFKKNEAY
ncbi:hypothetical protein M378DRAFT_78879 [Amanita muscaria Koide BX008]|uniref:Nitrogen regulatory protein areA GATA-like domain-containing protein n=1 Tax=Amanita muscaria (strain Koide BX008) TaxID=946122 RepID=A0A0C2TBI0_AMAMK|nr:hypothetical protein M378DRAFT_78879 [Amanita muscaria Koide BX008]